MLVCERGFVLFHKRKTEISMVILDNWRGVEGQKYKRMMEFGITCTDGTHAGMRDEIGIIITVL
jgi:hypothetical protein